MKSSTELNDQERRRKGLKGKDGMRENSQELPMKMTLTKKE